MALVDSIPYHKIQRSELESLGWTSIKEKWKKSPNVTEIIHRFNNVWFIFFFFLIHYIFEKEKIQEYFKSSS